MVFVIATALLALMIWRSVPAHAMDDGSYADSPLKSWFDGLASGNGPCCSFADGISIKDVDWDTGGPNNSYRVRICAVPPDADETWESCKNKTWIVVPPNALVKGPNKYGPAVVWPYAGPDVQTQIRCFLPGSGA